MSAVDAVVYLGWAILIGAVILIAYFLWYDRNKWPDEVRAWWRRDRP